MMPVRLAILALPVVTLLLVVDASEAQQPISFVGTVQWASSTSMQVMTDGGASIPLDLSRADQTSYTSLRGGDRVWVSGFLSADRKRVVAVDIRREEYPQSP
jgi:hypothetical protein